MAKESPAIFNQQKIRRIWDDKEELWYFSVIDVIAAITESSIPRRYWSDLKNKLASEGSRVCGKIVQLNRSGVRHFDRRYYLRLGWNFHQKI